MPEKAVERRRVKARSSDTAKKLRFCKFFIKRDQGFIDDYNSVITFKLRYEFVDSLALSFRIPQLTFPNH